MDSKYQETLIKLIKKVNEINYSIITKEFSDLVQVKKQFLLIKKSLEKSISPKAKITIDGKENGLLDELKGELEKLYTVSLKIYKSYFWGDFYRLNKNHYPELYSMMIDKNGNLLRVHDDFKGTIAIMDFHGYTKFSTEIKYNKTPLMEFGEKLPEKIRHICRKCHSLVYESEGDALIIIGPENPHYVITAVLMIIELARQTPLIKENNSKAFHGVEIKNAMIKKFEMNAAISTSGETFINYKGNIIGGIISEASRILKIVNLKKPHASGLIISDKVYRNLEKYRNENRLSKYIDVFDFMITDPFLVNVKGMRLKIREIFLENNEYYRHSKELLDTLAKEICKKHPSKWYNIINIYTQIIARVLRSSTVTIPYREEELNGVKFTLHLEERLARWINMPDSELLDDIIKLTNIAFNHSSEVRDMVAIYHNYINDNFTIIVDRLDAFYDSILKEEREKSRQIDGALRNYETEINKIKARYFPRRIFETIVLDEVRLNHLVDIPYLGKD